MFFFLGCLAAVAADLPVAPPGLAHETAPAINRESPKQVFILNSHNYNMPWQSAINRSIYAVMEVDTRTATELYTEFTGLSQLFDTAYEQKLLDLYTHKYAGSLVRNKDLTFWDLYKWSIIGVMSLTIFLVLLILLLLIQLSRRRRAERMLQKSHDDLEIRVSQRTADLVQINTKLQQEIIERKQAEQTLADSERRLADIIEFLPDPTWVINLEGKVIAWNMAVKKMTGIEKQEILGKGDYAYALPFYGERRPVLIDLVLQRDENWEKRYLSLKSENGVLVSSESFHPIMGIGGRYLAGAAARLYDARGNVVGAIESVRDITAAKRMEQERERLIQELQEALAKVRTLSGLLPICASCKNIRDDKGYWNQIETYISNHAEVAFSHSLCPECAKKLYGDQIWYQKHRDKSCNQEQT